ncbi:hypothetical protein ACVBIL_02525 [Shewanella sp. 125m-7]
MISLDSMYAMLAKPVIAKLHSSKKVKRLDATAAITPDSHEAPQSQLPPHLERRSGSEDRRKNQQIANQLKPDLERRTGPTTDRRDAEIETEANHSEQQSELSSELQSSSGEERPDSTHTKIDINV